MKRFKLIYLLIILLSISFGCKKDTLFTPEIPETITPEPEPAPETGDLPTIKMWTTDRENGRRMKLHIKAKSDRDGEYLRLTEDWNPNFQNGDYDPSDGLKVETWERISLDSFTYTARAENKWGETAESYVVGEDDDEDDDDDDEDEDDEDDEELTIVYFNASPSAIQNGESSELSWKVENADSVNIDQGIGAVNLTGTELVYPTATTTYTLTAKKENESKNETTTIIVSEQPIPDEIEINYFYADPDEIDEGERTYLYWETTNATKVEIDNGIGEVSLDGNKQILPEETITYTLTASAEGLDTKTANATVTVNPVIPEPPGDIVSHVTKVLWYSYNKSTRIFFYARNAGEGCAYNVKAHIDLYHNEDGTFWDSQDYNLGTIEPGLAKEKWFSWCCDDALYNGWINVDIGFLNAHFTVTWD